MANGLAHASLTVLLHREEGIPDCTNYKTVTKSAAQAYGTKRKSLSNHRDGGQDFHRNDEYFMCVHSESSDSFLIIFFDSIRSLRCVFFFAQRPGGDPDIGRLDQYSYPGPLAFLLFFDLLTIALQ